MRINRWKRQNGITYFSVFIVDGVLVLVYVSLKKYQVHDIEVEMTSDMLWKK